MDTLEHPILGAMELAWATVTLDGKELRVRRGTMIAAALLEQGIRVNRYTKKRHEPRGVFCGIGQCTDCVMVVNGKRNVRTCVTMVEDGMVLETQEN